jgi:hypothetical protein
MKRRLWVLFVLLALLAVVAIVISLRSLAGFKPSDAATIFAGLLAFSMVWWQGHLINKQMELQAIIELAKEWNCREMLTMRKEAWDENNKPDKDKIEPVLEFLEKVSTLERRGVVSADLIWDTFGWYVWRYHHYSTSVIDQIRDDWTNKTDPTLYCDLEDLVGRLLKSEARSLSEKELCAFSAFSASLR